MKNYYDIPDGHTIQHYMYQIDLLHEDYNIYYTRKEDTLLVDLGAPPCYQRAGHIYTILFIYFSDRKIVITALDNYEIKIAREVVEELFTRTDKMIEFSKEDV